MLRRLIGLCFALLVVPAILLAPSSTVYAQNGSPVAVDPETAPEDSDSANPATTGDSASSESDVQPASEPGDTWVGQSVGPIYPLPNVYLTFANVTAGGTTTAFDVISGDVPPLPTGFRLDNARIVDIETTATYQYNTQICLIYNAANFADPSTVQLFHLDGSSWSVITDAAYSSVPSATVCGYTSSLGTFAAAEFGASPTPEPTSIPSPTPTDTPVPTATGTATATSTATATATDTPIFTVTPTPATGQTQFALPNVWVTYSTTPASGTTWGAVLDGSTLPPLPGQYRVANAWFFSVSTSVTLTTSKQICVLFDAARFLEPSTTALLHRSGSNWTTLGGQVLADLDAVQGTICGYTSSLGEFVLTEHLPLTETPTPTATRTATATATPSNTATTRPTWTPTTTPTLTSTPTGSATATSTTTPSPSASPTATPTSTASPSATNTQTPSPSPTSTATLAPGSYVAGTTLRSSTRVNLRGGPGAGFPKRGVVDTGTEVQVTGSSVAGGGYLWVPVSVPSLGEGWIAGNYLRAIPTATPTRTPAAPAPSRTPGSAVATQTAPRPPGGFIDGDFVRTTTSINLRSEAGTSSQVLGVIPRSSIGRVTGPGISSGSLMFYPVQFDGRPNGYVAGKYLRAVGATPTPTRTLVPTATIAGVPTRWTTSTVNMRSGAGTGYRIVATLPEGTRLTITGNPKRSGGYDWYPMVAPGIGYGWIAGKFLTAIPPI